MNKPKTKNTRIRIANKLLEDCYTCTKFPTKFCVEHCSKSPQTAYFAEIEKKAMQRKCQVCGYNEVTDIHHEKLEIYILCPNHHALITRKLKSIKDYNIKPFADLSKMPLKIALNSEGYL